MRGLADAVHGDDGEEDVVGEEEGEEEVDEVGDGCLSSLGISTAKGVFAGDGVDFDVEEVEEEAPGGDGAVVGISRVVTALGGDIAGPDLLR